MSLEWIRGVRTRAADRRRRPDRRGRHVLFSDWRWAYTGRRRTSRRGGERAEAGVDLYEPWLFVVALGIFLLSCLDAVLTLSLVKQGPAFEVNPLMSRLLAYDVQTFVNLKIVLTGGGLLFLVTLAESRLLRLVRVRSLMHGVLVAYTAIVAYEALQLGMFG